MAKFQPGQSGNPQGRPRGVANKSTLEIRTFAQALLSDPQYQRKLRARLHSGELPPTLEALLFAYAFGKPRDLTELEEPKIDHDAVMRDLNARFAKMRERMQFGNGTPSGD
jgi:hypothetical protein